jgi:hypothetical protein
MVRDQCCDELCDTCHDQCCSESCDQCCSRSTGTCSDCNCRQTNCRSCNAHDCNCRDVNCRRCRPHDCNCRQVNCRCVRQVADRKCSVACQNWYAPVVEWTYARTHPGAPAGAENAVRFPKTTVLGCRSTNAEARAHLDASAPGTTTRCWYSPAWDAGNAAHLRASASSGFGEPALFSEPKGKPDPGPEYTAATVFFVFSALLCPALVVRQCVLRLSRPMLKEGGGGVALASQLVHGRTAALAATDEPSGPRATDSKSPPKRPVISRYYESTNPYGGNIAADGSGRAPQWLEGAVNYLLFRRYIDNDPRYYRGGGSDRRYRRRYDAGVRRRPAPRENWGRWTARNRARGGCAQWRSWDDRAQRDYRRHDEFRSRAHRLHETRTRQWESARSASGAGGATVRSSGVVLSSGVNRDTGVVHSTGVVHRTGVHHDTGRVHFDGVRHHTGVVHWTD